MEIAVVTRASLRTWFGETLGGLPRSFWFLWTGTLINRAGTFTIIYLEMFLVSRYHVSAAYAGFVIGLCGAGSAVGQIAGGVLADRWGRRPTMVSASLAGACATLALGTVTQSGAVAALALVYGMFNGLARPAFSAMMVDVLGERTRVRGFNLNYWAINLGFAASATLAGLLANTPRMTLFSLDAATTAISAIWIFVRLRETRPRGTLPRGVAVPVGRERDDADGPARRAPGPGAPGRSASHGPGGRDGLAYVLTDRVFLTFVLLNLGLWTIISTVGLIPITMLHHGLATSSFGSVIAVNGIIIVAGQLFVPRLLRNRQRTYVLAFAAIAVGVGFGAVAFASTTGLLMVTVLVWTIGEMISSPTNSALGAELSVASMRGRYQGIQGLSYSGASFLSPIIGGVVIDAYGDTALWVGAFGLGILVAAGQLAFGPVRDRRIRALRDTREVPETVAGQTLAPVAV